LVKHPTVPHALGLLARKVAVKLDDAGNVAA
jgi:hypothetical protein